MQTINKTYSLAIASTLVFFLGGCQVQDPNTGANTMQTTPGTVANTSPAAPISAYAPVQNRDSRVVGQWANPQANMLFALYANGAYQMQVQNNQLQGTWSNPQPGVMALTVNGQTTHYRYQLEGARLGLQDPNGQMMVFARATGQATASTPQSTPTTQAVNTPLSYPARYRNYNAPVLAYLAETLTRQNPATVARGLRSLSPIGHQLLASYQAFAEQLHWVGCQADSSLLLYNSRASGRAAQNCSQTQASWQSTYQLSDGAVSPTNCSQCGTEMLRTVVTFRCTTKLMSRQDCNSFMQGIQNKMYTDHKDTIRIINNMGGNNCICGDSGCGC